MKIAFLNQPWSRVSVPIRNADSIAIWTYEVARRLAREHEVVVFGRRFPGQLPSESHEGVRYQRVAVAKPLASVQDRFVRWGITPVSRGSMLYGLGYAVQAGLRLREERFDLVHVHNLSQYVPVLRRLNPKTPTVLHMHCEWMSQINRRTAVKRLEDTALVVACSRHVSERIEGRFPKFAPRSGVLHNGVDLTVFGEVDHHSDPPPEGGVVLFVGRISPEKGVHDLLHAFALVLKERPLAELRLVGPYEPTPLEYIVRLSREPRVKDLARFYPGNYIEHLKSSVPGAVLEHTHFVGEVDRVAMVRELRNAHVLANPSLSESFGMSLVEAMAARVPVVATRVGGMVTIVTHEKTGLLVPPADPESLALALLRLLGDHRLRERLVERGRASVEKRFSWDTVALQASTHYAHELGHS